MGTCNRLVMLAVCSAAAGLASAEEPIDAKARDEKLIAAVQAAAGKGLSPDEAEKAVGVRATLSTVRSADKALFDQMVSFRPDSDRKTDLPGSEYKWVAYWVREVNGKDGYPKVVGVCWPKEGKPRVFFCEILPPL
jgi:hypothetical protein